MHNYVYAKNGQKWLFSKYSLIIYRWKAYSKAIMTFVKKMKIVILGQNGPKWTKRGPKMVKNDFSLNIVVSYIVGKFMARWSQLSFRFFWNFSFLGPKWTKMNQKRTQMVKNVFFLNYNRVIYRWKAYGEILKFWAQNVSKGSKGHNNSCISFPAFQFFSFTVSHSN